MVDTIETTASAIAASANLVKMIKQKFNYTVEDLAVACGLTVDELNGIEMGEETPRGSCIALPIPLAFRTLLPVLPIRSVTVVRLVFVLNGGTVIDLGLISENNNSEDCQNYG